LEIQAWCPYISCGDVRIRCARQIIGMDCGVLLSGSMTDEKFETAFIKLSLLALLVFGGASMAHAAGKTWLGGASGNPSNWNTAANWTPTGMPADGDNITIPGGLSFYPIITTTVSNSVNNLTISSGGSLTVNPGGSLSVSKNSTISGTLTISGGSMSAASGNMQMDGVLNLSGGTFAVYNFAGSGTGTISGGTLQVGHAFTPPSSQFSVTGGTIEWLASAGSVTLPAGTNRFFNVVIDSGVTVAFDGQPRTILVAGNWTNNGTATLTNKATTVIFNGGSVQVIAGSSLTTFNNLTINSGAGVALASTVAVNGTLSLSSGVFATGANQIVLATSGSVSGGNSGSYVIGNLQKAFNAGNGQSFTFPIGDTSDYTPISLTSLNVTTAGSLTAKTIAGDHPDICSSGIAPAKDVNRYWTLTNAPAGIAVSSYSATFNFVPGDVDAGADTSKFIAARFSGSWSSATIGAKTASSTTVTGLTAFGDFAIGEPAGPQCFSACSMRADGCAMLNLTGVGLRTYTIQASTNLTSWTNIGIATTDATGNCQFVDVNAPNFPRRFYRAAYP